MPIPVEEIEVGGVYEISLPVKILGFNADPKEPIVRYARVSGGRICYAWVGHFAMRATKRIQPEQEAK